MKTTPCLKTLAAVLASLWLSPVAPAGEDSGPRPADKAWARDDNQGPAARSTYQGWKTLRLANPLIELQVLPDVGGRIIQFKLGSHEFLWVNPQLAGKLPPASGLTDDGGWFNIGGDKLWPAPQGWDNEQQWPGPPDAVLDGQPYQLEQLPPGQPGETAIRLTSRNDPRSGIRLSRVVRISLTARAWVSRRPWRTSTPSRAAGASGRTPSSMPLKPTARAITHCCRHGAR